MDKPAAILVIDIGATNCKLVACDTRSGVLGEVERRTRSLHGAPYLRRDAKLAWSWLLEALAEMARRFAVRAIVPTSHGSAGALIDAAERTGDGLVLPVMDYDAKPPADVRAGYLAIAPPYEQCYCPTNPDALTWGLQLHWQRAAFAGAWARATHILPYPQYWAWRLTGELAAERTSLGAQAHLWDPARGAFSAFAEAQGFAKRFPPLRNAWETLGAARPEIAEATGLPVDTPVLVGVHDSNANYARYLAAGARNFALLSTGTWIIGFCPHQTLERLDGARDMATNTDVEGRPVATTRYPGGREFRLLLGDAAADAAGADDIARLVAGGVMTAPALDPAGGPYRGMAGAAPDLNNLAVAERAALAALHTACMSAVCLDLLAARDGDTIIIEGPFADNPLFNGVLAALFPEQRVLASLERNGTALGAALLVDWAARTAPVKTPLSAAAPLRAPGLGAYFAEWRARAERRFTTRRATAP